MKLDVAPSALRKTKPWEHAIRFAFGGAITLATGLVAHAWGPVVAGLFLAFPAILPATLTLAARHDGRSDAADDARGARLGAAGLAAFAIVVAIGAPHLAPPIVLLLATLAWLVVNVPLWFVRYAR